MPEHFHLLITEPGIGDPSVVMKVVKERFTRQLNQGRKPPSAQTTLWNSTPPRSGKNASTISTCGAKETNRETPLHAPQPGEARIGNRA
ncbi:hypothetical protein SBA7_940035 [Candidatus Sulfotelmatobacter sp. SbA7]|nr:hypothetical protein SBA7_940035 [Candidatus Sulfotelmatobacter sp. SbA7]